MMDYTTLNKIRRNDPCADGWEKLLKTLDKKKADDEPLSFLTILESNGLDDAIWALVAHEDQNKVRKFACDCAEHVLHIYEKQYPDEKRPRQAIEVARKHSDGQASDEELAAAWAAAWDAAWDAARDAEIAWLTKCFKEHFCNS